MELGQEDERGDGVDATEAAEPGDVFAINRQLGGLLQLRVDGL